MNISTFKQLIEISISEGIVVMKQHIGKQSFAKASWPYQKRIKRTFVFQNFDKFCFINIGAV